MNNLGDSKTCASSMTGLADVRWRLERACHDFGRKPESVELICVSKGFSGDDIRPVIEAGERMFGENRVQEAIEKWPLLRAIYPGLQLHLIGPLQSNKADDAVGLFDVIQTVDRPKIAAAIRASMDRTGKSPKCLIQVNTGEEPQKAGVSPRDLEELIRVCHDNLRLPIHGLMCIPPVNQLASPHFAFVAKLAREYGLTELSMGMSADFELAVQLGATKIRVGSAIFGDRRAKPLSMKT
jgi:pyridoxal phosphate enzyme (YggS family)